MAALMDEVRARLPSVATLLECHSPGGHGNNWRCPLHDDRHASLSVFVGQDGRERWRCHGCGRGGDAIDLIAAVSGRTIAEVMREARAQPQAARTGSPLKPRDVRTPFDIAAAWRRASSRARGARADDPGLAYLATRFTKNPEVPSALIAEGHVGLLSEDESVAWLRRRAQLGYRLVIPLYLTRGLDALSPLGPVDLALRWTSPGKPPGDAKILRTPAACPGATVTYGDIGAQLLRADGQALLVVEGWCDYLTVIASGRAAVGLFDKDDGAKVGAALRDEIELLRREGVSGPDEVIALPQSGELGSPKAMRAFAHELHQLRGGIRIRVGGGP